MYTYNYINIYIYIYIYIYRTLPECDRPVGNDKLASSLANAHEPSTQTIAQAITTPAYMCVRVCGWIIFGDLLNSQIDFPEFQIIQISRFFRFHDLSDFLDFSDLQISRFFRFSDLADFQILQISRSSDFSDFQICQIIPVRSLMNM